MTPGRRFLLSAVVATVLTAALASTLYAAPRPPIDIPDPPAGKALIVFYRKWYYPGAAVSFTVREGKVELGVLGAGTYFTVVAEPGLHTYTMRAERHSDMQLVVEADETYYVRFDLDTGVFLYQPTLSPTQQWQFLQQSGGLKPSRPLAPSDVTNSVGAGASTP